MKEFLDNKTLLKQLMIRDFTSRYKSGALGLAWAMINPLLMLGLYSFVFVAVFKMRWELMILQVIILCCFCLQEY